MCSALQYGQANIASLYTNVKFANVKYSNSNCHIQQRGNNMDTTWENKTLHS